jgi:hypothetical protein
MSRLDRLDRIIQLVRREIPGLRLVVKADDPRLRRAAPALDRLMPGFMTRFTTVVGSTVYLPRPVDQIPRDVLAEILAHELVHQLDQRRWGVMFYVSYGVALPAGRSMRAVWERRAYAVDLMLAHHEGGEQALARCERRLVKTFSDRTYGWMWAGEDAARAFLQPVVLGVASGEVQRSAPYADILEAWVNPGSLRG